MYRKYIINMTKGGTHNKSRNKPIVPPAHDSVLIETLEDVGNFSIETLKALGLTSENLLIELVKQIANVRQMIEDTVWQAIQPRLAKISTKIMANVSTLRAQNHTRLADVLEAVIHASTELASAQTHVENGSTEQNQSTPVLSQSV